MHDNVDGLPEDTCVKEEFDKDSNIAFISYIEDMTTNEELVAGNMMPGIDDIFDKYKTEEEEFDMEDEDDADDV